MLTRIQPKIAPCAASWVLIQVHFGSKITVRVLDTLGFGSTEKFYVVIHYTFPTRITQAEKCVGGVGSVGLGKGNALNAMV